MDPSFPNARFDAIIVGGGPAGLSAGISVARANRSALLFDAKRPGRSDWGQMNHNYFGFPDGISIVELCSRGRDQAERLGVRFVDTVVETVEPDSDGFTVTAGGSPFSARGLILATGVSDNWVQFPGYEQYIGKSMHWCITCDGYEMRNQRVLVAGDGDDAVEMAVQMLHFTPASVTLLTNAELTGLTPGEMDELRDRGIEVIVDRIIDARARARGYFESVQLAGGDELLVDHLFSVQGAVPNTVLARSIGVELARDGFIQVDSEARTSVPGVYAAGDVTSLFSHQVLTAAHEGSTAAAALAYDLYQADKDSLRLPRLAHAAAG